MTFRTLSTSAALVATLACTEGSDGTETPDTGAPTAPPEVRTLTVDATDEAAFAYVDLDTGTVLGADAASGTEWDLAIRRFEIRTNGGESGPGSVTAGLAVDPEGYYDGDDEPVAEAFLNADAEAELTNLVTPFTTPELVADRIVGVFGEDWFDYDFASGDITAVPDVGWLVRSGEGDSFARVRVEELDFPTREDNGIQSFTVSVEVENDKGFDAPLAFEGSVPGGGGEVCFDMDTDATVDCSGTAWDLMLGFFDRDTFLFTNSGGVGDGAGGALGPYPWSELSTWTKASETPEGADLTTRFSVDESQSVFSTESWYAYNLQGQFRLYPNFRVYAVQIAEDGPLYAVQVTDYYDGSGTSGFVSLRLVEL